MGGACGVPEDFEDEGVFHNRKPSDSSELTSNLFIGSEKSETFDIAGEAGEQVQAADPMEWKPGVYVVQVSKIPAWLEWDSFSCSTRTYFKDEKLKIVEVRSEFGLTKDGWVQLVSEQLRAFEKRQPEQINANKTSARSLYRMLKNSELITEHIYESNKAFFELAIEGSAFVHYEPNNFEPQEKFFKLTISPPQLSFDDVMYDLRKIQFVAWGCHTAILKGISACKLHLGSVDCYLTILIEDEETLNIGTKQDGLAQRWVEGLNRVLNISDDFEFMSKQYAKLKFTKDRHAYE